MDFKKIIKGTAVSLLISLIFVVILAVVVYFSNVQERTIGAMIFGVTAISVFLGAYFLARNIESAGLLNGLALAGCYFAVILTLSLAVNGGVSLSASNFLRLLSCIASGCLGGVLGINTGHKCT